MALTSSPKKGDFFIIATLLIRTERTSDTAYLHPKSIFRILTQGLGLNRVGRQELSTAKQTWSNVVPPTVYPPWVPVFPAKHCPKGMKCLLSRHKLLPWLALASTFPFSQPEVPGEILTPRDHYFNSLVAKERPECLFRNLHSCQDSYTLPHPLPFSFSV